MSETLTGELSTLTMQNMHDAGLNPFAVQLLVESYARPIDKLLDGSERARGLADLPLVAFVWRGTLVTLSRYDAGKAVEIGAGLTILRDASEFNPPAAVAAKEEG